MCATILTTYHDGDLSLHPVAFQTLAPNDFQLPLSIFLATFLFSNLRNPVRQASWPVFPPTYPLTCFRQCVCNPAAGQGQATSLAEKSVQRLTRCKDRRGISFAFLIVVMEEGSPGKVSGKREGSGKSGIGDDLMEMLKERKSWEQKEQKGKEAID
jgi:hypothetical protein